MLRRVRITPTTTSISRKRSNDSSDIPLISSWPPPSGTPTSGSRSNAPNCQFMQLEARKYLYDIQQAARRLEQFTEGRALDTYVADAMLRADVERQGEIIGEALARLRKLAPEVCGAVTDAGRIIAFRNILIHGYADVDDRLVWNIVETKLPLLIREVADLIARDSEQGA